MNNEESRDAFTRSSHAQKKRRFRSSRLAILEKAVDVADLQRRKQMEIIDEAQKR
jgi:hypothetical protein